MKKIYTSYAERDFPVKIKLSRALLCAAAALSLSSVYATDTNEPTIEHQEATATARLTLKPLDSEMKNLASTLQTQFKGVPGLEAVNFKYLLTTLVGTVPADQKQACLGLLITTRLVLSTTKTFGVLDDLTTLLKDRLTHCGLSDAFLTDQSDLLGRVWEAYKDENNAGSKIWILPFLGEQLNNVSEIDGLNPSVKTFLSVTAVTLQLAPAFAPAIAMIGSGIQKKGGGCC